MIIYFTGTGNSRYIARILEKQLRDTAVNAAELIKSGQNPDLNSDKPYVFVSPVYAWRLPRLFEGWIKGCKFGGNKKAYFILTCGDSIGAADYYAEKFAQEKGFEYMGTAEVVMPENYIVMFSAPEKKEIPEIISRAKNTAENLSEFIISETSVNRKKHTLAGNLCSHIVTPFFYKFYIGAEKFYSRDTCISCGKCVESCMLNNIVLKDGRPLWGKACTHCMACICKCPVGAIEYGKHTVGLDRYICPKEG